MGVKNFVDYTQATTLTNKIAQRLNSQAAGFLFRGSSTFANLPSTLTAAMVGYVYNMSEAFTTDSRFVEGIGKKYPAGTNVAVADCSTYEAVADPTGQNPASEGWYELVNNKYVLSADTEPAVSKTYYVGTLSYEFDIPSGFIDVDGINEISIMAHITILTRRQGKVCRHEIVQMILLEEIMRLITETDHSIELTFRQFDQRLTQILD